jgi:hypothetical protein
MDGYIFTGTTTGYACLDGQPALYYNDHNGLEEKEYVSVVISGCSVAAGLCLGCKPGVDQ